MKLPSWQRNPPQVGLNHADERLGGEPAAKSTGKRRIDLDSDNPRPGLGKRPGERTVPGAEIEN